MIDHEFSQQAARLINSPYFYQGEGLERVTQKMYLRSQLVKAESFGNLPDDAKTIAKLAAKSLQSRGSDSALSVDSHYDLWDDVDAMLATPKVTRRYGRRPGPGWTPGGTSSRGVQIWLYGTAPAPAPTSPTPPPTTPTPTPTPTGAPLRGGVAARAASIAAHTAAMAKLNAGQQLTAADKASLARKLTNMPTSMLRSLHTALGGTGAVGNAKATVTAVRALLTGTPSTPTPPSPTPAPTTPPSSPTPSAALLALPPGLQSAAGEMRAIAIAQHDGLISLTDAETQLKAVISTYGITRNDDVMVALGVGGISNTQDFVTTIATNDPGHIGTGPPGPPPRPGLVWNPNTHRWILPPTNPSAATPPAPAYVSSTGYPTFDDPVNDVLTGKILTAQQVDAAVVIAEAAVPNSQIVAAVTALGGTVTNPNSSYSLSRDLRTALNAASNKNTPATPAPTPNPKPFKFQKYGPPLGAAATSSTVSTIPFADETDWESGKPQTGVILNGVPFESAPPKFWEKTPDVDVGEPPTGSRHTRAGIMIVEPDGRVWIAQPTNQYGGRKYTLPGGTIEAGLTDQQNALKETWEETGLQVEITGYLGDFDDANYGKAGQSTRTGRLYVGRRIGGAPWDAKPEPGHIPPSRKNGSTAESEVVTLVTPERAAKLLDRTDDQAALMTVAPIPIDTPTKGTGSEPIKKLVAAIQPAAQAWLDKQRSAGAYRPGNQEMHVVQELRGFNKPPKVVGKKDMDDLIKAGGHIEMLRAVSSSGSKSADQLAEEFRSGDHYPGHGIFGSGTYADSSSSSGYPGNVASNGSYGGAVVRIALPKTAKIIKVSELEKLVPNAPDGFKGYQNSGGKESYECWMGVQAALAGYDAIHADGKSSRHHSYGKNFYVILNRGAIVVQKEDAGGHRIP